LMMKMTKNVSKFAVAAAAAFALQASVTSSDAAVLDLDAVGPGGDWTLFNWHGETADPPFTSLDSYSFTVPEGTQWVLQVTDYAESGDRFEVMNGAVSLGSTSLGTPGLTT